MVPPSDKLNAAYWRKRALQQAEKQVQKDGELNRKLKAEYDRILHELDKELSVFYARYAANEGISLSKARKLLRDAEMEDFRMSLDEFRDKAIAGGYEKELNEIYLRTRISRLQALETQIELRMQELFQSQRDLLHDHLAEVYMDTYYQTVYAVSQQTSVLASFARVDTETVEKLIASPWLGSDFSSRVWADRDKLVRELETALSQAFVRGEPLQRTAKKLAERMGVSYSRAAVLVETESAHASAQATMRGYRATGVSEYQFEAGLDLKTCEVCGAMDGRAFKVFEQMTGVNYPPLHPRCRCTTVPVVEFEIGTQRAARDPATDKTVYVDKSLTYGEWYSKYVQDVPEAKQAALARKNERADRQQYARYLERLGGKNVPRSFASFQKMKYNEPKKWEMLKSLYRGENCLQQQLSYVYNGEKLFIPRGTKFENVVTMAGSGAKTQIRIVDRLVKTYGGTAEEWKKQAGKVTSDKYVFDIHWYQRDDGVQHDVKLKNRTEKKR